MKPKKGHKLTTEQRKARVQRGRLRLAARMTERKERRAAIKAARGEKFTALLAEADAAKAPKKVAPAAPTGGANG
jgi:hypothetical protein